MPPTLHSVILNGPSRHRLNKGFMLIRDATHPVDSLLRDEIVNVVNQCLRQKTDLADFNVEARRYHPSLLGLVTPFLPVYDVEQRNIFIQRLARATSYLIREALHLGCRVTSAGVNPYFADEDEGPSTLCADIHQIEVFDEGEIERIYNLFRQFLPELLAFSAHSAVYAGMIQKDFSLRMRVNPTSFLPRYMSQFSMKHLDQLRRILRKDYGLADLCQMDVNPLGGDAHLLSQTHLPLLGKTAPAVELRFIDAQYSYPFIRAQIILFQAIAMYGRALAREGKRLPYMHDKVIDENKALSIQGGAGALLKPDMSFKNDDNGRGYSYHHKGIAERATTALLMAIDGPLAATLQHLDCELRELAPFFLGAELRQRRKRCLVNYAEYQRYLHYVHQRQFFPVMQKQIEQSLTSPLLDMISDYNHRTYPDLSSEIEALWTKKLSSHLHHANQGKEYSDQSNTEYVVPVICDLRQFNMHVTRAEAIWTQCQQAINLLTGRALVKGQALEVRLPRGKLRLWVVDTPAGARVTSETIFRIVDVLRNPHLIYRCRICGQYGPFRCGICEKEHLPERLCADCARFIKDQFSAYCPDHIPTCSDCRRPATFCCSRCHGLFAEHLHRNNPRNPDMDYCKHCYKILFEQCVVCERQGKFRLGRSKCAFKKRNMDCACAVPLCWEHSFQWKIWGPHNRGITLCQSHKQHLGETDIADLLYMMLTAKPPYAQRGKRQSLPNPFRLRRIINRNRTTALAFDHLADSLQTIADQVEAWGWQAKRNYVYLCRIFHSMIDELPYSEAELLAQIKAFYLRTVGPEVAEQIERVEIIDRFFAPGQPALYRVYIQVRSADKGQYIGRNGTRINQLSSELRIEVVI